MWVKFIRRIRIQTKEKQKTIGENILRCMRTQRLEWTGHIRRKQTWSEE